MSVTLKTKKLASILATSLSITMASMEAVPVMAPNLKTPAFGTKDLAANSETLTFASAVSPFLERMLCIHYPPHFRKDQSNTEVLIIFCSEVNIMILAFAKKLGFRN